MRLDPWGFSQGFIRLVRVVSLPTLLFLLVSLLLALLLFPLIVAFLFLLSLLLSRPLWFPLWLPSPWLSLRLSLLSLTLLLCHFHSPLPFALFPCLLSRSFGLYFRSLGFFACSSCGHCGYLFPLFLALLFLLFARFLLCFFSSFFWFAGFLLSFACCSPFLSYCFFSVYYSPYFGSSGLFYFSSLRFFSFFSTPFCCSQGSSVLSFCFVRRCCCFLFCWPMSLSWFPSRYFGYLCFPS